MKNLSFFLIGIPFGIIMTKSEVISWFRITEMFRFEAFHMYGVIGVAVVVGAIVMQILKKIQVKTWSGEKVHYEPRTLNVKRHLLAGSIFGIGWAITGACPGPMWVLLGNGFWIVFIFILGAFLGTLTYGKVMNRLP
jgi:uncharacterized membrane protein YedE/YeeE